MRAITRTIVQIDLSAGGGYSLRVACNAVGEAMPCWDDLYANLSWVELVDVLLEELDARRPGWALDEGRRFHQPTLLEEL